MCRTSSSTRACRRTRTSRGRRSGAAPPRASRSRRCTRGRRSRWRTAAPATTSCAACSAAWPRSTATSPAAATRAAAGWRRSCTRGSPGSTTARPGTRRWPRSSCPAGGVEPYERQDRRHVDPSERPSDAAYDRFVHLARVYRDRGYADGGESAFLVEDPLFNSIWLWSTHALAEIAQRIGEDAGPFREAAAGIHAALLARLWDGERFRPHDLVAGRLLEPRTILGFGPLLDPDLPADVLDAMVAELCSPHFRSGDGIGVASSDLLGAEFDRRRYWRGPVWANLNWLLARGLRGHGLDTAAAELEHTTVALVERAGHARVLRPGDGRRPRRRRVLVDGRRGDRHPGRMNVTIWNENVHERTEDHVRAIYPEGIHGALAAALAEVGRVRTATLEQPEHGLSGGGARARPTC